MICRLEAEILKKEKKLGICERWTLTNKKYKKHQAEVKKKKKHAILLSMRHHALQYQFLLSLKGKYGGMFSFFWCIWTQKFIDKMKQPLHVHEVRVLDWSQRPCEVNLKDNLKIQKIWIICIHVNEEQNFWNHVTPNSVGSRSNVYLHHPQTATAGDTSYPGTAGNFC